MQLRAATMAARYARGLIRLIDYFVITTLVSQKYVLEAEIETELAK